MQLKFILATLLLAGSVQAAEVSLAWDASPSPEVTGYKVYVGSSSRSYGSPITIGNQMAYTVTDLAPGKYFFAVTAFDAAGNESDYSNEVSTILSSGVSSVTLAITAGPAITQLMVAALSKTSATIVWVTNADCSGVILYGTDPQRLLTRIANNLGTTDHLGVLSGLTPLTHYFFKARSVCGERTIESDLRSFNTK